MLTRLELVAAKQATNEVRTMVVRWGLTITSFSAG